MCNCQFTSYHFLMYSPVNGKAEMQTELEETEEETGLAHGSASWLAAGIHLEEEQYAVSLPISLRQLTASL